MYGETAQEQCYWVTDLLDMTLAVDRAVKPQHKQTNRSSRETNKSQISTMMNQR